MKADFVSGPPLEDRIPESPTTTCSVSTSDVKKTVPLHLIRYE